MYSVPDVCVVNAGVLDTRLVDAFDHCLGVTGSIYVCSCSTPSVSSRANSPEYLVVAAPL